MKFPFKVGDKISSGNHEWTITVIEDIEPKIRLESDRLDDNQPYWLWLSTEQFFEEGFKKIE